MTIARILVPVRDDDKGPGVFAHAAALARRFGAHVQCVHCRARPDDFMPFGVNIPRGMREQIQSAARQYAAGQEEDVARRFHEHTDALGLVEAPLAAPPSGQASASLEEVDGRMADVVRVYGRLADMVALAKPDRDRNLGENSLRAALFRTARPALMCPPGDPADGFGDHVAVAWNGSVEATRSLALALPVLVGATTVTVLDGGAPDERIGGAALTTYLRAHGATVKHRSLDAGRDPGRAILRTAAEIGASLIVSGAYGQSREQETVFGGVTQTLIDTATLPVLMTH